MSGLDLHLAEAARAVGSVLGSGAKDTALAGISTDTRSLKPGELFFALRGENFDGHEYIDAAFARGAAAVVVDKAFDSAGKGFCLKVDDTLRALGELAAYLRRKKPLKVLALTGSNGKTTTKEMLVNILSRKYNVLATKGNYNNLVGLPLTLFRLEPGHEAAVLEMGMNVPGEIARLTEIAGPDVGLVTNVGPAHLEGLGDIEGIARAKGELYAGLNGGSVGVVNIDDRLVYEQSEAFKGKKFFFGFSEKADVTLRGLEQSGLEHTGFDLETPQGKARVDFALLGKHNAANAMAAAAAALAMGASLEDVTAGLNETRPYPGRLELKILPGPVYLIDDTYNANPVSTEAALEVLSDHRGEGRALAVLGDMLELGAAAKSEHEGVGVKAASLGIDFLFAIGPESAAMAEAAKNQGGPGIRVEHFKDALEAGQRLAGELRENDRVLVKGSRGMRMERIVEHLTRGRNS